MSMPRKKFDLKISGSIQELRQTAAEHARSKILAGDIVVRLRKFTLGQNETLTSGEIVPVVMSPAQVMAARILLAKVLPDLQTVTLEKKDPLADMTTEQLRQHLAHTIIALQDMRTIDQVVSKIDKESDLLT